MKLLGDVASAVTALDRIQAAQDFRNVGAAIGHVGAQIIPKGGQLTSQSKAIELRGVRARAQQDVRLSPLTFVNRLLARSEVNDPQVGRDAQGDCVCAIQDRSTHAVSIRISEECRVAA